MSIVTTASHPWDMAGADGLVAAKTLLGDQVDRLAPFQSLETTLEGLPCAVLRLCDRNFRITYPGPLDALVADRSLQLWVKQQPWLGAIVLPAASLPLVAANATVRAPHRLRSLPLHCAAPAQLSGLPILVWHHPLGEQPGLELQAARVQIGSLCQLIQSLNLGSVSLTTARA
ncbi:hypothetical protein IQ254_27005 [Nodosilinea sp. LEGE 07088]|uniref:hypothetical protein n=1 Tax=Nodosilinea sp. LEGE 07088 TaxID=2777968 RepID=UPI0018823CE4|nr:hypothetical protein [Nodosilinea sp. LEGE 07088]MBE9140805.1 hypothetical protein [Nodosilinea sp. LEGE 07088]